MFVVTELAERKETGMQVIRTDSEAAAYAAKVVPEATEGEESSYPDDARCLLEGALVSLIRLHGRTTTQQARVLCSDLDQLREALRRDSETERDCQWFLEMDFVGAFALLSVLRAYLATSFASECEDGPGHPPR